jgi:DNA-binding transcriptional MerR regulator
MLFSMSEAAKATGVAPYRIKYALQTRRLPEPGRVGGRRVFGPDDVELIRRHFAARGCATKSREEGRGKEAF